MKKRYRLTLRGKIQLIALIFVIGIICIIRIDNVNSIDKLQDVPQPETKFQDNVVDASAINSSTVLIEIDKLSEETVEKIEKVIEEDKYPIATTIWNALREKGYNEYVCAGIMGNFMAETGGQTLNINPNLWSSDGYYGIAQWSPKYFPEVCDKDLDAQLEFLFSNIEYEFNTFGKNYQKGFNYEKFLLLTDCREAALAFAKCYERCDSAYYTIRQDNSEVAYEHFVI